MPGRLGLALIPSCGYCSLISYSYFSCVGVEVMEVARVHLLELCARDTRGDRSRLETLWNLIPALSGITQI